MSIVDEIHSQRPAVRHTMFVLAVALALSAVVFVTMSSVQKDIFFATHSDPDEQQAFLARREEGRPQPLAAISRAAGSMMASIGSLIGWDTGAGFDRSQRQDSMQGGVHLLPLSQ
jgi:hypothetical protein